MGNPSANKRRIIEGRPALIVIDIQALAFDETIRDRAIPIMPGYRERMLKARRLIDKAARTGASRSSSFRRSTGRDLVDFGRELDGDEEIHCLEDDPNTAVAVEQTGFRPDDYLIRKRRYLGLFSARTSKFYCAD